MSLVECKHVTKKYGVKVALDDVNLTIEKGKIIGLLGPNGSGKTTLIKLLNDLLVPNSGEILIQGNHPGVETKKIISYLPERTYLNFNMKIKEVIQYFKDFYEDFREEVAHELGTTREMLHLYFTEKVGQDFRSWRTDLRINDAKQMLLDKRDTSINLIGEMVGFSDRSNFHRQFSKLVGCSPKRWRDTAGHPEVY